MNVRKVHEYVWGKVARELRRETTRRDVIRIKETAVIELLLLGRITKEEQIRLFDSSESALCLAYVRNCRCDACPLFQLTGKDCMKEGSLWDVVIRERAGIGERVRSAETIRDIFDITGKGLETGEAW